MIARQVAQLTRANRSDIPSSSTCPSPIATKVFTAARVTVDVASFPCQSGDSVTKRQFDMQHGGKKPLAHRIEGLAHACVFRCSKFT